MSLADLAPYPDPDTREHELDELAVRLDGELVVYGQSREDRPLRALRLPGGGPRILCTANIHGVEYIAGRVALGLAARLADRDPELQRLRARAELWLIPCLNPDGYARTWSTGGQGRLAELRANAAGVDLNRNFPRPGGGPPSRLPGAGSDRPGDATYRGPHPLSEPETAALDRLFAAQRFHASVNLHSFMGTVIPARVTDRDAYATYRELARVLAHAQPARPLPPPRPPHLRHLHRRTGGPPAPRPRHLGRVHGDLPAAPQLRPAPAASERLLALQPARPGPVDRQRRPRHHRLLPRRPRPRSALAHLPPRPPVGAASVLSSAGCRCASHRSPSWPSSPRCPPAPRGSAMSTPCRSPSIAPSISSRRPS
jgi:hypothetical protein